jgi:predicted phage-related endonuclease
MSTSTIEPIIIPQVPGAIPTREDWLEQRRRFIGGSDSASLFDLESKYGCSTRLFFDKQGQKPDYPRTQREEDILKRGNVWESVTANYFAEQTGLKIRRWPARVSKEHPFMGVNMDRQIVGTSTEELKKLWPDSEAIQKMEGECGPGYLECKTTNEYEFKRMMQEGITVDYIFQVNHGLVVTGYKWGAFAVLEPTWGQFASFPVVFIPGLGDEQVKRSEAFWDDLQAGVMPEPKVNDKRCKNCLYRRSCPRSKDLLADADKEWKAEGYVVDDSLAELVSDYREALSIADSKQETVDAIKERIKEQMGAREKVEVPSCGMRISWSTGKPPMRWDGKALEGTIKDLQCFDFPEDATCQFANSTDQLVTCGKPAEAIVEAQGHLVFGCEVCAIRWEKLGNPIVGRKGVANLIANCKRPGEPSRPFKFIQV